MLAGDISGLLSGRVTGSAFTKARYKIKPGLFKQLCQMSLDCYLQMSKKRWKGLLVLAIDGSTSNLPHSNNIESYFGGYSVNKQGIKRHTARMLMVYDVLNNFVLSARLSKMCFGETRLLDGCIRELAKRLFKHIYVMDRNFDSFSLLRSILAIDEKAQLCVRLSSRSGFYKRVLADERDDFEAVWQPSRTERCSCRAKGLDSEPFTVRVTKVLLKSGEIEILISTLMDMGKYSGEDLSILYGLRWGVEEGFKNLKPKMKLEDYGCKKTVGVYQEFFAHIFMMNLVGLHGMVAQGKIEKKISCRKYSYTYNWKNGYRFVRASIVKLISAGKKIGSLIERLIDRFELSMVAIKPGRSFIRDMRWNKIKTRITHYNK